MTESCLSIGLSALLMKKSNSKVMNFKSINYMSCGAIRLCLLIAYDDNLLIGMPINEYTPYNLLKKYPIAYVYITMLKNTDR